MKANKIVSKSNLKGSQTVPSVAKESKRVPSNDYLESIVKALRNAPSNTLSINDIVPHIRGLTSSTKEVIKNKISNVITNNPSSGIVRVGRGVYKLDNGTRIKNEQQSQNSQNPQFEQDDNADETHVVTYREFMQQRHRQQKCAEAIMGLTRIIVSLVTDEV